MCALVGNYFYVVFVAKIRSWEEWALHNHGTYSRPDHNPPVVDELVGPNPVGPGDFVLRREIHTPVMGPRANSVTVELSVRLGDGAETRVKSRYVWLRPASPATMLRYLDR